MPHYLSYLMGADKITNDDLLGLDIKIIETRESGSRKLEIPEKSIENYKKLICDKLNAGFWNEIVGQKEIFYIFRFPDSSVKTFTLSVENEPEVDALCAKFNNEPAGKTANVYKYLSENDFYHDVMLKYYVDLVNRES